MNKKSFSYAEAMVTMLIVAIIMVATTPILTQRRNVNRQTVWSWANDANGNTSTSTFFGTGTNQRVLLGSNNLTADEKARLIIYEADTSNNQNTPIMRFLTNRVAANTEVGRLITKETIVGLGRNVLNANTAATNVTAIGAGALSQANGNNNTAFGFNACANVTDGTDNICIGAGAGPAGNVTGELYIGPIIDSQKSLIWGDFQNHRVDINGDLYIKRDGTFQNLNEIITFLKNKVEGLSDARLKNISGVSTAGLAKINQIVVKNYTFKKDKKKTPHVGVIAQELQKIFPNSVTKGDDGYLRVNREEIFFAMVNAIKELDAKFNKNDEKVQKMEQEIENLRKENAILTQKITDIEKTLQKK